MEWRRSGASTAQEPPPAPGLTLTWEISSTLSGKDAWLLNTLGGRGLQQDRKARVVLARRELFWRSMSQVAGWEESLRATAPNSLPGGTCRVCADTTRAQVRIARMRSTRPILQHPTPPLEKPMFCPAAEEGRGRARCSAELGTTDYVLQEKLVRDLTEPFWHNLH